MVVVVVVVVWGFIGPPGEDEAEEAAEAMPEGMIDLVVEIKRPFSGSDMLVVTL